MGYLLIIMALSIGFSFALYRVSVNEINDNIAAQIAALNRLPYGIVPSLERVRIHNLHVARNHLVNRLVLLNIFTLAAGGGISYYLARRTLGPVEEAVEMQSRFTSDASHELKTPLAAMQTEIEVGLRNPKLSAAEARELLKSNLEEVLKLKSLSESLLQLTGNADYQPSLEPLVMNDIIHDAIKRLQPAAAAKHITIQVKAPDKPLQVLGNDASLTEVLAILLDNAVKYSGEGSNIVVQAARHGRQAEVRVRDQGIGIKAGELPHIFERFYRADSSRSKETVAGYGLGLSIAKKLVDINNGKIEAASAPGKGSTFTVKLPAIEP